VLYTLFNRILLSDAILIIKQTELFTENYFRSEYAVGAVPTIPTITTALAVRI